MNIPDADLGSLPHDELVEEVIRLRDGIPPAS